MMLLIFLLDSIANFIFRIFAYMFMRVIGFEFFFLVIFLSFWCQGNVDLIKWIEILLSSSNFWKRTHRVCAIFYLNICEACQWNYMCLKIYFSKDFKGWTQTFKELQDEFWGRKWQPTPVLLPGGLHGQRRLAGHSSWGCKELDVTEWLTHTGWIYGFQRIASFHVGCQMSYTDSTVFRIHLLTFSCLPSLAW